MRNGIGKFIQFTHHVINTVGAKGDADPGNARQAKDPCKIIITATTA